MHTGQLLTTAIALLITCSPFCHAVELVSQQIELGSSSQITPANGGFGGWDQSSRNNNGFGDRSLETTTQATFSEVEVSAGATLNFRRTNSASADSFHIHSRLALHSQDYLAVPTTQLTTRASAVAIVTIQVRSETAFRYNIQKTGHYHLPGGGGLTITAPNGTIVVNHGWTTGTTAPSDASGVLPPGTYTVRFSDSSNAEGMVSPILVNHIEGDAQSLLTLTFTPASSNPIPEPSINILRDSTNRVVLELTNLVPGTYYTIERGDSLQPNSWQYLFAFVAAGATASWTDTLNVHTPTTFYRLRF
ncbi:MAG TPA: hypothetical protein VF773_23015 [Verrucomicrobiae bacterium]